MTNTQFDNKILEAQDPDWFKNVEEIFRFLIMSQDDYSS